MATNKELAWWEASFDNNYLVKKVEVLTRNMDANLHLSNVEITIDGALCEQFPSSPPNGLWLTFNCYGDGATGNKIKLQRIDSYDHLIFCGIKVYGVYDPEAEIA